MSPTRLVNRMLSWIGSDALYLRCQAFRRNGEWLNLRHPKAFNQKLQWLKLYYRRPHLRQLVNKYECRAYVEARIGPEYLTKLVALYDSVDEIDWDALPQQFAMKVAHGSGMNIICTDKRELDVQHAENQLRHWCSAESSCYLHLKEWAYGGGRRCIVVEELLSTPDGNIPNDFKFFCFNGEPKFIQVDVDRFCGHQRNYYDIGWNLLPFRCTYQNAQKPVPQPPRLAKMIDIARALAHDLPFARIDLYAVGERIIFGEITLYPDAGLTLFEPKPYNRIIGDMLALPERSITSVHSTSQSKRATASIDGL